MFVRGLIAPCKGCVPPKRSANPNYHTYCEEYIEYCNKLQSNKDIKNDIKKKESDFYGVRHANMNKIYDGEHKYKY